MSRDQHEDRGIHATLWIVILALGAVVLFSATFMSGGGEGAGLTRSQSDHTWVSIDDRKHIARDNDGDGQVDCLRRTGLGGMVGMSPTWAAAGQRCGRFGRVVPMGPELRDVLTRTLAIKFEQDLAHHSPIDHDGDGRVDCTVNVHNTSIVLAGAAQGACPGRDATGAAALNYPAEELQALLQLKERLGQLTSQP